MTLEEAWNELHEALPWRWYCGTPMFNERRNEWTLYAYDTTERLKIGKRSRDCTAVDPTQEGVLREMARCLGSVSV